MRMNKQRAINNKFDSTTNIQSVQFLNHKTYLLIIPVLVLL